MNQNGEIVQSFHDETAQTLGGITSVQPEKDKLYIGTAKYGHNAFLVEFDPATKQMQVVVDAHKDIGTDVTGFAAQAFGQHNHHALKLLFFRAETTSTGDEARKSSNPETNLCIFW